MNYELALKLKELGFPEITRIGLELNLRRYTTMDADPVSFPLLQELIAECGTYMERLEQVYEEEFTWPGYRKNKKIVGWRCGVVTYEFDWNYIREKEDSLYDGKPYGRGATPEEAAANLWIAINNYESSHPHKA